LDLVVAGAFAIVALLYSAVGQAGGTGYVAVMGVLGYAPDVIKPTVLALNILVAAIGCARFQRNGLLSWRACYPFGVLALPFSFVGGTLNLPAAAYQPTVGLLLLLAAAQMARSARRAAHLDLQALREPPFGMSLLAGAAIGLVSGTTGVGGGIFLAPLILAMGWAETRKAAAIAATFNLLNSTAALAGAAATVHDLPVQLPIWSAAVVLGGMLGSWLGSTLMRPSLMRLLLAILLAVAGFRMVAHP